MRWLPHGRNGSGAFTEVADGIWLISFMDYDPGFLDQNENGAEPVSMNPCAPEVLPMSPE